jgi:hypothetical protein
MFDVDPTLSIADQAQRQSAAAMQYAQLNPMQQATYNDSMANATVAAGVGELGRVGMAAAQGQSAETPQQKMAAVKAQISQALQGKDMSDPEQVYPVIIQTLQAAGLMPQAMAAVQEFETIKRNRATDARADRTQARLEAKDAATADFNAKKLEAMKPTSKLALDIESYSKALAARDAAPEGPGRAMAQKAVDAFEAKLMDNHKVTTVNAGDRIQIIDQETGNLVREVMKGTDPNAAARTASAAATRSQLPAEMADKLARGKTNVEELNRLSLAYQPAFAGRGVMKAAAAAGGYSDFMSKLQAVSASTPAERAAAEWWAGVANRIMRIRHEIFGATLTAGETQAFDAVRPLMGLPPEVVKSRLDAIYADAAREHANRVGAQAAQGRNVGTLEADVGGTNSNIIDAAKAELKRRGIQ